MKKIFIAIISLFFLLISGCSSLETAVKKRNIETQTKMSETIWLNPEYITDKTIFIQVKNTSMADISIERDLKNVLAEKGYKIVNTPKTANYWLQINILRLENNTAWLEGVVSRKKQVVPFLMAASQSLE